MFTVVPNVIEQSDFTGGWNPDQETPSAATNTLRDMLNLMPELGGTGALVTRKGFKRIREEFAGTLTGHYIKSVHHYRDTTENYIICVVTDDTANANNVRLYAIKLSDLSVARIDTAGRTWANPTKEHWGMTIDAVYYGGSPGNDMYSWDGTTWDATAHTDANWKTLVDSISPGATERARDFAFKGDEIVTYSGDQYRPAKGIRYDTWESGQTYVIGQRVSRSTSVGGQTYWRSYRCIKGHTAETTNTAPGTGTYQDQYWQKVRLPLPVNSDSETSDKWYFVPLAPGTSVAEWHANRLWMRYDGQGDKSRVLYSAPVKPEKGVDVADLVWDPTDFAPGNDTSGEGGGWIPFNDGKKGGVVTALRSYGQYLVVFKRQAVWVLSGNSEDTFTVRRLAAGVGCVGPSAVDELDGLLYFLSDDGLYVTDGTAVEPVPGFEKFANTIESRIDAMVATSDDINPFLVAYDDRIWMSLPNADASAGEKYWTVVYDPNARAAFKTNLPVGAMLTARHEGIPGLYFGAPVAYSAGAGGELLYKYNHADAGDADDTGAATYASTAIAWQLTTAWWPFGLLRAERRVRRVWAVVKGALTYTITAYRNWDTSSVKATTDTGSTTPGHIEGEWFADSHAVSFKVSSTAAPAVVYGVAVHTEPRRARYHRS